MLMIDVMQSVATSGIICGMTHPASDNRAANSEINGETPEPAQSSTGTPQNHTPAGAAGVADPAPKEIGGRGGLEPTRYGDWEKAGRCIDF